MSGQDEFHVMVEAVKVVGRHRKDLGDIDGLAKSMADVGLLNPITLTLDNRLVAGERRLAAARRLGWESILCRYVDNLDDAARLLHAERDENTCRKDMLPSEMASLGAALYSMEAQAARQRQRNGQERGRATQRGVDEGTRTPNQSDGTGKATESVGEALGMAGRTYQELRYVYNIAADPATPQKNRDLAREALDAMDGGAGVAGEARRLRAKLAAQEAQPEAETETPATNGRTTKNAEERRVQIRELASQGYSSHQIAERVGVVPVTVRDIAKRLGVTIQADRVMGRARKSIDSNRVVRETVQTIADLGMGLNLIDYDELDPAEIATWTASLSESIRMLNRLNKRLKEMAQ